MRTVSLVLVVLSWRVAIAFPEERPATDPPTGDKDHRTMTVRITDEAGAPLESAGLRVSMWFVEGYSGELRSNADYRTDAAGLIAFKIPRRLQILRLWPRKEGYVPEFVNFGRGTHDEGKQIPDRYEFQLAKGTELSGTVLGESGRPIPGVTVEVRVEVREPAWGANPEPMISTWLTDEVVTDTDGGWSINNAPAAVDEKDYEFRLKFTHPDYVSDSQWGELQREQSITTGMLRDGTAKIVLSQGVQATGTVVDSSGEPVSKGLVIWSDSPYGSSAVHETEIDESGQFETLPLAPGEYPFTIAAPGYRPERRLITITNQMDSLRFELEPGKRLTLNVVDRDGRPIPNAAVSIGEWRGARSLYNSKHSSVPDSGIPRRSDANGVYTWDWAPDDVVTYYVSAKGFSYRTVKLIAIDAAHIITLTRPLTASGRVVDGKTGEPVKEFRVVPVTVFRPKFLSTSFRNSVPGENGAYEIELADNAERDYRYQVRVDADGYRSALSEDSFGLDDGRITIDFSLEPTPARQGTVLDPDGKPVGSATIVAGTPSAVPAMRNTELEWGGEQFRTAADGTFQLAATFEPARIRITHESGFAEVLRQPHEEIGTIRLQPWGRVSGQLLHDGKPVPEQRIYFSPIPDRQLGEARFQDAYSARTHADGRFEFERLPPVTGSLGAYLGPWQDSPLTSSQSVPLNLQPGEHRTVSLGSEGVNVTGKVVATGRDDAPLNKNWSLNYLIRREPSIDLPAELQETGFNPDGPVQASWFLDPRFSDWRAARVNFFVKLAPDGQLRISGVPPGKYDLVLRLYEQPAGCLVETVGEKVVPIEVTRADVAFGTKDIGVIEVACRAGPRPGENMQVYDFIDTTGRQQTIADLKGRYVLMQVWASWCAPCLEHMPAIKASLQSLSDEPITFVGLNIDEDSERAKSLANRGGWDWSQNYLGEGSDTARQLAISTVPTYFLIGPDGLLVGSSTEWSEMEGGIRAALKGTSD